MLPFASKRRRWPTQFVTCLLVPGTLALLASGSGAQAPARTKADPLDAEAEVPRMRHEPSLSRHQRYAEQPVGSWREANETVNRIGGWRAYAREAHGAASAPAHTGPTPISLPASAAAPTAPAAPATSAASATPPAPPASAAHTGHHRPR